MVHTTFDLGQANATQSDIEPARSQVSKTVGVDFLYAFKGGSDNSRSWRTSIQVKAMIVLKFNYTPQRKLYEYLFYEVYSRERYPLSFRIRVD